jgi:RimJ/RimL family protein N-acetyltransferase
MQIRPLLPADAADFHALRLRGLREVPSAFGSSYEEEKDEPASDVAERIRKNVTGFVMGAFDDGTLVGVVGMHRSHHVKAAHKMELWGMYVAPEARRLGAGRKLVEAALRDAFGIDGIRQVNLGVNAANLPALRLYEAMGFIPFGLERDCLVVDGIPQDEIHMVRFRSGAPRPA